ncbi:MAG: thiol-disulfide isomerase [Pseudomonadota bacterium]
MSLETLNVLVVIQSVVLALLVLVVFALARQIGILHTRLAPAGALMNSAGPEVGQPAPLLELLDIEGRAITVGGMQSTGMLILFVSPTCPVCKELVPVAKSLAKRESLKLLFASDGSTPEKHQAYRSRHALEDYAYLLSPELGIRFAVDKLPNAALISADGILRSRGLVNSREHLESLVESMLSGYPSIQDYLVQEQQLERVS